MSDAAVEPGFCSSTRWIAFNLRQGIEASEIAKFGLRSVDGVLLVGQSRCRLLREPVKIIADGFSAASRKSSFTKKVMVKPSGFGRLNDLIDASAGHRRIALVREEFGVERIDSGADFHSFVFVVVSLTTVAL